MAASVLVSLLAVSGLGLVGAWVSARRQLDLSSDWALDGTTLWLTGLPGAGKSRLALMLEAGVWREGGNPLRLDGDELMRADGELGWSAEDRGQRARRATALAIGHAGRGGVAIVAIVSPCRVDRLAARRAHEAANVRFLEVWVDTPLAICRTRDKGLTGVDEAYEPPEVPDVRVDASKLADAERAVVKMMSSARAWNSPDDDRIRSRASRWTWGKDR